MITIINRFNHQSLESSAIWLFGILLGPTLVVLLGSYGYSQEVAEATPVRSSERVWTLSIASDEFARQMPSTMKMPAEVPSASGNRFGFSFPPPRVGEPGVTPFRRSMVDGAEDLAFRKRVQDEIWLISSRSIQPGDDLGGLQCDHHAAGAWQGSSVAKMTAQHASDLSRPTFVMVHGNRTDSFWAQRRGLQVYQAMFGNVEEAPPIRFVIWSWPTNILQRPLEDFRAKAERSLFEAEIFGQFLTSLDTNNRVGLMGYSLGTQVVLGGLETMSRIDRCDLAVRPQGAQFPVMVVAPVTHCRWPQGPAQIDEVIVRCQRVVAFRNPIDSAMRAFELLCRGEMGCECHRQPRGIDALVARAGAVEQHDVSAEVGREHHIVNYARVARIQQMGREIAFGSPVVCE